jgi:SAM-dependent methyltransferase
LDPAEYEYLFDLEDHLWWFVGQRKIAHDLISRNLDGAGGGLRVLDAGCGTGGSLPLLQQFGQVTSFDYYPRACELFATRERGRILVASTDAIPFADASFDLVTSFDVICQLEAPGDERALEEIARVLRPGGLVFVRVPALQALYGSHDATLQTKHRYTTGELARKLRQAGLEVLETTYSNTILFPVALVRRLVARATRKAPGESDVRGVPAPVNAVLTRILLTEAWLLRFTRLPVGLSAIALARKP